jgi:hypothetical protein
MLRRLIVLTLAVSGCVAMPEVPEASTTQLEPSADSLRDSGADDADLDMDAVNANAFTAATGVGVAPVTEVSRPSAPSMCAPTSSRIEKTMSAILDAASPSGPTVSRPAWDHVTPPENMERVKQRLGLTDVESAVLAREGFVVPARLEYATYAPAYHEIYQSQLPLYVSADAIFHSVFVTHDELVEQIELARLLPLTEKALGEMHRALKAANYPSATARDLDLYLTVARSLLAGQQARSVYGVDAEASALVQKATRGDSLAEVQMFGRARMIDFSQYKPRGHYARSWALSRYFRGAMWLSRLELNLVSRSSRSSQPGFTPNPDETPHEAMIAVALADLAERSSALAELEKLDRAWALLAGPREDVTLSDLAAMKNTLQITSFTDDAFPQVKAAIGDRWKRTARLHYMPQGSTELPAIATLLGPRVVFDAQATRPLVHGELPDRYDLGVADIAYALGHDRAKTYLASDLAKYPQLPAALDKARAIAQRPIEGNDLYGAWFGAIRALSDKPHGELPSFMKTDAFADLRIDETVAAYGQLKHNHVLVAGQPYDEGACEIPDGFVEPVPATWAWLEAYADRGAAAMTELDPRDSTGAKAYFARLGKIVRVLRAISLEELAGRPLSSDALAFLSMVVEIHSEDIGTGWNTTFNGWYFDFFSQRPASTTGESGHDTDPSFKTASFIGDFYTSVNTGQVAYAGARGPRLGVFVVDTGGPPRVVVGPVAHAYEFRGPLEHRVTDAESARLKDIASPWEQSYTVAAPAEPPLALKFELKDDAGVEIGAQRTEHLVVTARSTRALGKVTIEIGDHHRAPITSLTKDVATREVAFDFKSRPARVLPGTYGIEMVRVKIGDYDREIPMRERSFPPVGLGGMKPPAIY